MTMPHFTNTDLVARYGYHQKLHFAYYLKHARPSFAVFAFTVANYRFDGHKLTRRSVVYGHISYKKSTQCDNFTPIPTLYS